MAPLIRDPSLSQSENFKRDLIEPAVNATLGILKAAREIPTIKKVVITS